MQVTFSLRVDQCLQLMLDGRSDKEIAQMMGVSYKTVKNWNTSIFDSFKVRSRSLVLSAFLQGRARRAPGPGGGSIIEICEHHFVKSA